MSVGLQRLREDAGRDPQGRDRQGRGPGDRRSGARGRRRAAASSSATATRSRPSGTPRRSRSARRSRAARSPTAPRSPSSRRRSVEAGERIAAIDTELADVEAEVEDLLLRIPNPADPDVPIGGEEANVTVRTWGEQLPVEQPLEGEVGADAPAGGATWRRKPHWEIAEALDIIDLPRGAKIAGSGFPVYKGAGLAAPARADQLVPRRPHRRERLHRGLAAGRRQQRLRPGHRPDPRQGRPDVRRHPRRPVPGPDGRGPGHEPPPRRDPRGRRAADPLRRLHARASGARPAPPARTPGASSASTSSTRSRWSCSRGRATRRRRSSG